LNCNSHGNGRVGVMVEVNCETDFVARSEAFRTLPMRLPCKSRRSPRYINTDQILRPSWSMSARLLAGALWKKASQKLSSTGLSKGEWKSTKRNLLASAALYRTKASRLKSCFADIVAMGENIIIRRFVRWEWATAQPHEHNEANQTVGLFIRATLWKNLEIPAYIIKLSGRRLQDQRVLVSIQRERKISLNASPRCAIWGWILRL